MIKKNKIFFYKVHLSTIHSLLVYHLESLKLIVSINLKTINQLALVFKLPKNNNETACP